jgi:ferric iron reductase protein FhuF
MLQQLATKTVLNFLKSIHNFAGNHVDSFYIDHLIFTQLPDDVEIVSLNEYLKPDRLLSVWKTSEIYQKTQDIRITASIWNKVYSWKILPGVLAFMTLAGVGLNTRLDNISFVLKEGQPKALWFHDLNDTVIFPQRCPIPIPQDFPGRIVNSVDALHESVFTSLFQDNFALMIERVHHLTKLSQKTMWGNAVNASERLFGNFKNANQAAIKTDYSVLYEQRYSSVMPGRNPLYNLVRTEYLNEPGLPDKVTVRRTCCLYVFIPPCDGKCPNCPLFTRQERIAYMKHD